MHQNRPTFLAGLYPDSLGGLAFPTSSRWIYRVWDGKEETERKKEGKETKGKCQGYMKGCKLC